MTDFANAIPTAVDIVRREKCYEGFYKLDRVHLRHELFAGGMSREINREVFVRHDAVCMLPYDPQRDEVVLIEQFRVGAMGKTDNPWLIELVAGLIDKDEVAGRSCSPRSAGGSWACDRGAVADDQIFSIAGRQQRIRAFVPGALRQYRGRRPAWAGGRSRRYPRHGLGL